MNLAFAQNPQSWGGMPFGWLGATLKFSFCIAAAPAE
jgi:hypothetical protein